MALASFDVGFFLTDASAKDRLRMSWKLVLLLKLEKKLLRNKLWSNILDMPSKISSTPLTSENGLNSFEELIGIVLTSLVTVNALLPGWLGVIIDVLII